MKKLSTTCMAFIIVFLLPSVAFPQAQYLINGENPASVFEYHSVTITLDPAGIINTSLITAGCMIDYDASDVLITSVIAADGDVGGPWSPGFTSLVPDGGGPGTYMVFVGNWDTVPVNVPIPICEIEFFCQGICGMPIIISTIPHFDTVVGDTTVWDPQITNGIIFPQTIHPCSCEIVGPRNIVADAIVQVNAQYAEGFSTGLDCKNPPNYVWFDECDLADMDQTGLLTVPPTTVGENCTICFVDMANTDVNTGGLKECCLSIEIWGSGACDCEGNFDNDEDQDGSDAATFKLDFGRSIFLNPCSNGNSCNGDFDCDVDVDGTDAAIFKEDFGRSQFSNPCPSCPTDPWCTYP